MEANEESKRRFFVICSLVFIFIVILCECLPNSLVLKIENGVDNGIATYDYYNYCYFNFPLINRIIFTPFITFLATIACFVIFCIRVVSPLRLRKISVLLPFVFVFVSLFHMGFTALVDFTPQGLFITIFLFMTSFINFIDYSGFMGLLSLIFLDGADLSDIKSNK